jgi:membrane protein implicated in regulation of membrane protease activity
MGGKYMQYLFIALLVLSAALECFTAKGVFLCFVPASLVSGILAFLDVPLWIQLTVFALLVLLSLLFLRPLVCRLLGGKKSTAFAVEDAIGTQTVVVERLDNLAGRGAVTVDGMEWAARTLSDDIVIEAGTRVEIIAVEGVKFICRTLK